MLNSPRRRRCEAEHVIAREGGRSSIPEASVFDPRSRSVLDAPPARGMTAECVMPGAARHRTPLLLLERRQLRAVIGNEDREQACGLCCARVLADEMLGAG